MGGFNAQIETLNLHEALHCFFVISVVAFFVSLIFNSKIKSCPVLAVELSILATLLIFPAINTYLNMATMPDYELARDVASFPHSPSIFFFPLPVCVLVSIAFYIYREKKIEASSERLPSVTGRKKARTAAWILSLLTGSLWLYVNMAFEKSFQLFTVLRFFVYTICGFAVYLVVELILWIVRSLSIATFALKAFSKFLRCATIPFPSMKIRPNYTTISTLFTVLNFGIH